MNYQTIPGFEDIRIGYVIKKNKNHIKNETKRRPVRIVYVLRRNKQTKSKQLYILISTTSHITHNTTHEKKIEKKDMNK